MTNFRRPGPAAVLRSPRGRIIGSLFTVLLVAVISLMVYAMIPFRGHATRTPGLRPGTPPINQTQISATGTGSPAGHNAITIAASGGTHAKTAHSTTASSATANRTATSKTKSSTNSTTGTAAHGTTTPSHPDQLRAKSAGS